MSRVLVTGGVGFLGAKVVAALAARPDVEEVIAGDVRRPTHPNPAATYADCDVTDPAAVAAVIAEHAVDVVVHLAAIVNPGRDAQAEYRVDVDGSRHVIDACVHGGVRRLVVSSSGAAYGYRPDNAVPLTETAPLRGNDEFSYSRHKRLVEEMLAEARQRHPSLEQVVFRIGTILGPDVDNQITALWAARRILRVRGSDSPFVFAWVDDVAAAFVRAATDGPAGVFNVAGEGSMSVPEIAERLHKKLLTVPASVLAGALRVGRMLRLTVHGPERVGFLRFRPVLDATALRREFGFTPAHTSREAFDAYLRTHPALVRA